MPQLAKAHGNEKPGATGAATIATLSTTSILVAGQRPPWVFIHFTFGPQIKLGRKQPRAYTLMKVICANSTHKTSK